MEILLTALNTRHTHSALGLAYIKSYCIKDPSLPVPEIKEFDLNQTNESIIAELILRKPDILAFSVYIWSIDRITVIAGAVKTAHPEIIIILGGPEVSFNSEEIMQTNSCVDFIVRGEGEEIFAQLTKSIMGNHDFKGIKGITWRENGSIVKNQPAPYIENLDSIPSPFQNGIYKEVHSFTYYEASRGCPSKCSYCLSSVLGQIRNLSIERVKADLDWFFNSNYRQVRFADRTFNHDKPRAREIINYIKTNNKKCINFHFEIQADFLTDDILDLLAEAPDGMFHLEIGIQTTNQKSLKAVNRRFDLANLFARVKQLKARTGCHLHLDLLGGLPEDSFADFCKSLDDVWELSPHSIQISLVKILHGTPLEALSRKGAIHAMPRPPYTILRTSWLTPEEAIKIQDMGKLVEGLYNCERFPRALSFIVSRFFNNSASSMFLQMVEFWRTNNLLFYNFSPENICRNLSQFAFSIQKDNLKIISNDSIQLLNSILDHELRLSQKVPAGNHQMLPDFASSVSKHQYRPEHGYKAFWYYFNPLTDSIEGNEPVTPFPLLYLFQRDLSATPEIKIVKTSLAEAFTFTAIQQRVPLDTLQETWQKTWPKIKTPDFAATIEKLLESRLIYDPVQRRKSADASLDNHAGD